MSLVIECSVSCIYQQRYSNQDLFTVDQWVRACESVQIHMCGRVQTELAGGDFSDHVAACVVFY